ncbi:hypothetical protein FRC00_013270 [Tulasnella sp. 408]|nr:hypothetical protein FRC00_013270 [Tulasnella sp. 408]
MEYVDFAYKLYESKKDEDVKRPREFKRTFSVHVEVEFVGVWDTVASIGLGVRNLPFNASETFIHQTPDGIFHTLKKVTGNPHAGLGTKKDPSYWCNDDRLYHGGQKTDVLEVWFPGFHSDVGGGNELNEVLVTLANPSLRWMVTEILKANTGVVFKEDAFNDRLPSLAAKVKAFQNAHAPTSYLDAKSHHHYHSSEATEGNGSIMTPPLTPISACSEKAHERELETHHDEVFEPTEQQEANGDPHDMLLDNPLWYLLEILPLKQRWMDKNGKQVKRAR